MSSSQQSNFSTGAIKLSQDIGKLFNNRQGCDVQFKVGGSATNSILTGETVYDSSAAVTMYAHTLILRCRSRHFEAMFKNEKEWRERSGGIIHKPNISSSVFYKILDYIYTGDLNVKAENLFEVMVAAEEMELEELSIKCQQDIMVVLKQAISTIENNNGGINETEESKYQHLTIGAAIHKIFLPTFVFAHNHKMTNLFQEITSFTISHINTILSSGNTRIAFFEGIPTQIFRQILASDALEMKEYDIWELAFNWACFKTKVPKSTVEAHFRSKCSSDPEYDIDNSSQEDLVSVEQLKQLKIEFTPLLLAIRFNLIDGDQYSRIVEILNYFLPIRRMHDLKTFHAQMDQTQPLDIPRLKKKPEEPLNTKIPEKDSTVLSKISDKDKKDSTVFSKITDKEESWQQIKTWIVESKGIGNIHSVEDVNFKFLFRASEHFFSSESFHDHCNNKGPTLVIVDANNGHLFGGVNFLPWKSDNSTPQNTSNFLFTLADGCHRNIQAKFSFLEVENNYQSQGGQGGHTPAVYNNSYYGPVFGYHDLEIYDCANSQNSRSVLSNYVEDGKSGTTLAGSEKFKVAEYEVFSIYRA